MAGNDGINMQVDAVNTAASNTSDLGDALTEMQRYAAGDGLQLAHFGGVQRATEAGRAFLGAVAGLAKSVGTAARFAQFAATAMTNSAKATTATDEQARWNITNAGQGV